MFRRSVYKKPAQLRGMIAPGEITSAALDVVAAAIRPGISTLELDRIADEEIRRRGAHSNFQLVDGYHHTVCASVNEEVVDRKSTRLNSSHVKISYADFCMKKKKNTRTRIKYVSCKK